MMPTIAALAAGARSADAPLVLPQARRKGERSLEECLAKRRSVRSYAHAPLSLAEISQLLWAAQGITAEGYLRTAPSAGALYPLEIYLVAGDVEGLSPGIYHYRPQRHELVPVKKGDIRSELAEAALGQDCIANAAATLLFAAVYARTASKYGQRAERYVHMEAGHAAQNVSLEATALGLGTVTVGAFEDDRVLRVATLPESHDPIYLLPVGRK
jgi:SagB-type dehydrogenase family enzyme